jgi:hypothetical protein
MTGEAPPRPTLRWLALSAFFPSLLYIVKIWSADLWWHLATGRYIVEHHAIPRVDPFSFTAAGTRWYSVDWLADLILYGTHRLGGVGALTALAVVCAFLTLLFLGLALRELGLERATIAATVVFTGVLTQTRFSVTRPMIFGAVLLAVSIWLALRWWRLRDRGVLAFVPLTALWLPLHPTVTLGLLVCAGLLVAAAITRAPRRELGLAALALAGCVAVFALTEAGRGHLHTTLQLGKTPLAIALTVEWQPSRLSEPKLWLPAALLLLALADAARVRKGRLVPAGLALLGALMAARYVRNLYEGLLLAAPLFALFLDSAIAAARRRKLTAVARVLPFVFALGLPGLYLRLAPNQAFNGAFGVGFDLSLFPQDSLSTLRKLPEGRLIHDCTFGGYLMWERIPVYCDGRTVALYDQGRITELWLPLYLGERALEIISDRYDIRYGLARRDTDFERGMMKSEKWIPLHFDRSTSLFIRKARLADLPSDLPALDDLRYVADAAWMKAWYDRVLADPARRAALERAILRSFQLTPDSPTLLGIVTYLKDADPGYTAQIRAKLP